VSAIFVDVIICAASLTAAACASPKTTRNTGISLTNPLAPSEPHAAPSVPDPASFTVTITDGWTGAAVAGARVSAGNIEAVTGADGSFHATTQVGKCLAVDILADGFLHRRVCAKPSITLWPVASEAEADATRTAAFHYGDRLTDQAGYSIDYGVLLGPDLGQYPGVRAIWTAAADEIRAATNRRLSIPLVASLTDEGYLVSIAAEASRCSHGWFTWDISVAGFCWMPTSQYFLTNIALDPAAVERPDVALRALLYSYALSQHPLPGLMNATHPATELSEFERKTLHMMSLRWGTQVTWPDFDKIP
jgi:hypothetical protein